MRQLWTQRLLRSPPKVTTLSHSAWTVRTVMENHGHGDSVETSHKLRTPLILMGVPRTQVLLYLRALCRSVPVTRTPVQLHVLFWTAYSCWQHRATLIFVFTRWSDEADVVRRGVRRRMKLGRDWTRAHTCAKASALCAHEYDCDASKMLVFCLYSLTHVSAEYFLRTSNRV